MTRTARGVLAVLAVTAATVFTSLASPATPRPATVQNVSVGGARLTHQLRVLLSGQITCTAKARFTLYAWILDQNTGTIAKGETPPKTKPASPAAARLKTATTCTGTAQPWRLTTTPTGKKPTRLTTGPAHECITTTLRKNHHYTDLKQTCATIPIS